MLQPLQLRLQAPPALTHMLLVVQLLLQPHLASRSVTEHVQVWPSQARAHQPVVCTAQHNAMLVNMQHVVSTHFLHSEVSYSQ